MSDPAEFTGERFLPDLTGEIWAEHWHRYLFAAQCVAGKDVLDAACGEGYGAAWLARRARSVTGLDIDAATVSRAGEKYGNAGCRFELGSVTAMPFANASFDCVVSFETLEHLAEQEGMLAEFRRVLRPDGLLIISTPNRVEYSERRDFHNEFHVRELDQHEFEALLARHFAAQRWFGQKLLFNSAVWPLEQQTAARPEWIALDGPASRMPVPMYFIALAAASPQHLPDGIAMSLLTDPDESIYREYEQTVRRAQTLEHLVREREVLVERRDRQLQDRADEVRKLEALVGERERVVQDRDRELTEVTARGERMEALLLQRDREIEAVAARANDVERLMLEREALIVKRDQELAALDIRIAHAEGLVEQRDALLEATNARMQQAERLIAERETLIVERDRQLAETSQRAEALEKLVVERARELELVNEAFQQELARRSGFRWWLALPFVRLRRMFTGGSPSQRREA